jgi:hypothetical protein
MGRGTERGAEPSCAEAGPHQMNEADEQTPTLAMNKNVISREGEEEQEEGAEDEGEQDAIER